MVCATYCTAQRRRPRAALISQMVAPGCPPAALSDCNSLQHGSMNEQNAKMDIIVLVVLGNRDFYPIRFRAKIAFFDFESNIVTTLVIWFRSNPVMN